MGTFQRTILLILTLAEPLAALEPSPTPTHPPKPRKTPLSLFRKPTPDPTRPQPGSFGYSEVPWVTGLGWSTPDDFRDFIQETCGVPKKKPSEDEKVFGLLGTAMGTAFAGVAAVQWLDAQGKKAPEKGPEKKK